MKKILISALALFAISACSNNYKSMEAMATEDRANVATVEEELLQEPLEDNNNYGEASKTTSDKLIKTGDISIEAETIKIDSVRTIINQLIKKHNGFKSQESKSYNNVYEISISVPSQKFESLVDALDSVGGKIVSKSIKVEDKTGTYTDIESRVKSKEAAMEQYRLLMKKATKMSDIIELQTKMDELQEEIDSKKRSLMSIDRKASYSQLHIELLAKQVYTKYEKPGFGSEILEAISGGLTVIKTMILAILYIWPIILIGVFGYIGYNKYKRKKGNTN